MAGNGWNQTTLGAIADRIGYGLVDGPFGSNLPASAYTDTGIPVNAYHNRAIATQEVIEELIRLAKEMREAVNRGEDLGLNDDEIAFYDALAMNESAVQVMGVDELKVIATELVMNVRKTVTIDWTVRESARAKIRVMVRRILKKHGYPPDLREEATRTVLEQAELLCADWAA